MNEKLLFHLHYIGRPDLHRQDLPDQGEETLVKVLPHARLFQIGIHARKG